MGRVCTSGCLGLVWLHGRAAVQILASSSECQGWMSKCAQPTSLLPEVSQTLKSPKALKLHALKPAAARSLSLCLEVHG